MIETPRLVQTDRYSTACIRLVIPRSEMMRAFGQAVGELTAALAAQGVVPMGSAFAHHFKISPDTFDFDLGFLTPYPIEPTDRVNPGIWPAQRVARTVYQGPYEGLPGAWCEFSQWMEANDIPQAQDLWEHYQIGPHSNPDSSAWRTELTRPLLSAC